MKARFNKDCNIEIEIESLDDLKILGLEDCEDLSNVELTVDFSEDARRTPVEVTGSKHPTGLFLIVNELP